MIVPQAGAVDEWPEGLYEAEMRVAAFQNGYFTALCNRVGKEDCLDFAGESFVCGPDGDVLARGAKSADDIVYAEIDLAATANSNARRLFLKHRRPESSRLDQVAHGLKHEVISFVIFVSSWSILQHELIELPELCSRAGVGARLVAA